MQSDVNFPLVLCKPASQIIQLKFNQCKRFVLHPHFLFIYLTISILGSSIIFWLSLKYTLRFVPSTSRTYYFLKELAVSSRRLCRYSSSVSFFIPFSEVAQNFFSSAFSNLAYPLQSLTILLATPVWRVRRVT